MKETVLLVREGSALWQYLSPGQRNLADDGALLIEDRALHPNEHLSDYSYLVFPFAKLYEGFLKQLFCDLDVITLRQYESDHFRIGKALSPNLARLLHNRSAFAIISKRYGETLAFSLWSTWKEGRNLVFHYFPHNVRKLAFADALSLVSRIVSTMELAVSSTHVRKKYGDSFLRVGEAQEYRT